jgi:hypothetical protein
LQYFFGCRVAGSHASTVFANSNSWAILEALGPVLDCCEVAPICWIARALGARGVTHYRPEVTHPVHVVARALGTLVAVVAHDAFAEVLSAHAVYTDAGKPIEVAGHSVLHWHTPTRTTTAMLYGAFVLVGWAHDAYAQWVRARARKTHIPNSNITPRHRNHAQRADTQESE